MRVIHREGGLDVFRHFFPDLALEIAVHPLRNCPSQLLASQVEKGLEPLRGRISEFDFEDHHGVRLDVTSNQSHRKSCKRSAPIPSMSHQTQCDKE